MKPLLYFVASLVGFSVAAEPLKAALYVDDGCRGSGVVRWAEMLRDSPDVELKLVSGADIRGGALAGRDLLVMPGGHGGPQYKSLGDEGAAKLKAYVAGGGKYFGTCCGLAIALNEEPGFAKRLKMLPLKRKEGPVRGGFTATVKFNRRGREWLGLTRAEWGIRYHNGPVVEPSDPVPDCTALETLATMDCELAQKGPVVGAMYGTPAAVRATYGKGEMLAFNCHPEMFPSTRELVVAGIRALTGHTIRLVPQTLKSAALRNAPYFNGAFFASRIRCPIRFIIGFIDEICPPPGIYAAYNNLASKDKGIVRGLVRGHGGWPEGRPAHDWQESRFFKTK